MLYGLPYDPTSGKTHGQWRQEQQRRNQRYTIWERHPEYGKDLNKQVDEINRLRQNINKTRKYNQSNLNRKRRQYWSNESRRAGDQGRKAIKDQKTSMTKHYTDLAKSVANERRVMASLQAEQTKRAEKRLKARALKSTIRGGRSAGAESKPSRITSARAKFAQRRGRGSSTRRRTSRPS